MGVDAGDFDNDGDEDLFITEQTGEGHNLYVNDGHGVVRRSERAIGSRRREPRLHRLRHGVVRLRQRRLARSADGQRRGADHPGAGAGARSVSAASAQAAVPQSRQRPLRGRHGLGRRRVPAVRGRPRRRVRRHRQRRRHRRRRRQQQRPAAAADQQRRQPEALARLRLVRSATPASRHARRARRDHPQEPARRSGAARGPTAATRRRTIRACSSASAIPTEAPTVRVHWPDGRTERVARMCRSIATRR